MDREKICFIRESVLACIISWHSFHRKREMFPFKSGFRYTQVQFSEFYCICLRNRFLSGTVSIRYIVKSVQTKSQGTMKIFIFRKIFVLTRRLFIVIALYYIASFSPKPGNFLFIEGFNYIQITIINSKTTNILRFCVTIILWLLKLLIRKLEANN